MPSPVYSENQLRRIWELQPSEFRLRLPQALSRLYADKPPPSEEYLSEWTFYLRGRIRHECRDDRPSRFRTEFVQLCMEAGLVPAILGILRCQDPRYKYARPYTMEIIGDLAHAGDSEQNRVFAKQFRDEGGFASLLQSFKSELCTERAGAVMAIRALCSHTSFSELCSPEEIAVLMCDVLEYTLKGHASILEELDDPNKTYQKDLITQPAIGTITRARIYAPRWQGMSEEHACWTAHSALCRERRPSRRECLAIIEHRPEILDLLLKVALRRRTEWYPESVIDGVCIETLQQLLMLPYGVVPGLPGMGGGEATDGDKGNEEFRQEWDATVRCWNIFVKTEKWRERLLAVWQKVEREEYKHIWEKYEMTEHYLAQVSPDAKTFAEAVENRGFMRICVLRILINMTYLPASVVPLPIHLSFLATAYKACLKVPSPTETLGDEPGGFEGGQDLFIKTERTTELCRTSVSASQLDLDLPACIMVAPEPILGPTLVMRIISHVISEGLVDSLSAFSKWKTLPPGTPPETALVQVRQITSLPVLGKIVRGAITKRLKERKESGHLQRYEADFAVSAYISAAELAVAIRALDKLVRDDERKVWEKETKSISKEIALCLGSAADFWAELDEWQLSEWTSRKAVECLEGINVDQARREGWDAVKMKEKNQERLEKARYVLRARVEPLKFGLD